jgi:ribonuclease PH
MAPRRRSPTSLRPVSIRTDVVRTSLASALISQGRTQVLITANAEARVPNFLEGTTRGWVTAEYDMLPGSTPGRKSRQRWGTPDGRVLEIGRLVGRALRAAVDLEKLTGHSIRVDCDVLEADGGTRTAAVTGGFVALAQALRRLGREFAPAAEAVRWHVAAVSVGLVDGNAALDLDYALDSRAQADLNVVMTEQGKLVEVQGCAEGAPFSRRRLQGLLALAARGIAQLVLVQKRVLQR